MDSGVAGSRHATAFNHQSAPPSSPQLGLQASPHCTNCNSPPIDGQCTNHRNSCITVRCSAVFIARHTRDIDIANLSVRLSVRYVPVLYEYGLTCCHGFFTTYGSAIILVLSPSNTFTKFRRGHPLRGH